MTGALESSVTLDDVFVVVGARRVPLAAELAGYLALEIAEGAADASGEVDPQRVYIGEEGSVALVRPRRDEGATGDAETSIRALLARLLEASGSQTPALGNVVRRRSASGGLAGLIEELEAALIPVNRAAGRRALARLAREVKRVTLQVGRNASLAPGQEAPRRGSSPAHGAVREPASAARSQEPPPVVAARAPEPQRPPEPAPSARSLPERAPPPRATGEGTWGEEPPTNAKREAPRELRPSGETRPDASELPTMEVRRDNVGAALANRSQSTSAPGVTGAKDEVDHLLASFAVSNEGADAARHELKALVGLEPTPPPPGSEHAHDPEPQSQTPHDSDVESLLNLSDAAPAVAPRATGASSLGSPPTAISPKLANEPYGGHVPTVASAQSPPASSREPKEPRPSRASYDEGRTAATSPSARKLADLSGFHQPEAPRTGRALSVMALLVLGGAAAAVYVLQPSLISGRSEPLPAAPPPSAAPAAQAAAAQAPKCRASIVVTGAPENAEILLRVGQAPVDVDHMPSGAPLEFVATAEGFAPKRLVIPASATWDNGTDGKPRYEAAVQLDKSRARPGTVDNWPGAEPGSEVGGKGGHRGACTSWPLPEEPKCGSSPAWGHRLASTI